MIKKHFTRIVFTLASLCMVLGNWDNNAFALIASFLFLIGNGWVLAYHLLKESLEK